MSITGWSLKLNCVSRVANFTHYLLSCHSNFPRISMDEELFPGSHQPISTLYFIYISSHDVKQKLPHISTVTKNEGFVPRNLQHYLTKQLCSKFSLVFHKDRRTKIWKNAHSKILGLRKSISKNQL